LLEILIKKLINITLIRETNILNDSFYEWAVSHHNPIQSKDLGL